MRIDTSLSEFLQSGVIVAVGTRDASLAPAVTRGWGGRVCADGDSVELFVGRTVSGATLANLRDNGRLAVIFGCPLSFRSAQIKGRCTSLAEPEPDDRDWVERHRRALARSLAQVGISPDWGRLVSAADLVRIRFEAEAIFDQTPGPRAGAQL